MLDWKILAASFAALLFVSSMLIGGLGITDFFSTIVNKISEWFGSSPFGNVFSSPAKATNENVDITLYTSVFTLKPDSNINISTDEITLTEFNGEVEADFQSNTLTFKHSNTPLTISTALQETHIINLKLDKLLVENIQLQIKSEKWNITSSNASIEIYDFYGTASITNKSIILKGNVSRLVY